MITNYHDDFIDDIVTKDSLFCCGCDNVINDSLICTRCNEYKLLTIFEAIEDGHIEIVF
jgi:hypothetical protein